MCVYVYINIYIKKKRMEEGCKCGEKIVGGINMYII